MSGLRVVSDNSEAEKRKAALPLKFALATFTANLLCVVRGAGKPELLIDQIDGLVGVLNEYTERHGNPSGELLSGLLRFEPDKPPDNDCYDEVMFENAICERALQMVASTLLDHRLQRDRALSDFRSTLGTFVDIRERKKRRKRPKRTQD